MFLDGNRLYFADRTNADLYSIGFTRGVVSGTPVLEDSTIDWRARGTFVWNGTPAVSDNQDPTAVIAAPTCTGLACTFDAIGVHRPRRPDHHLRLGLRRRRHRHRRPPQHTFPAAGTYPVTLTVTDNRGGTDTTTLDVTVTRPQPAPIAAIATPVHRLACTFDGSGSTDPDGQITTYAWDFGDGTTATGRPPQHTYAAAGTYPVTLTVTDNRGGTDTTTLDVTVTQAPNQAPIAAIAAPVHRPGVHVRRNRLQRPRRPDHHLRLGLRRRRHRTGAHHNTPTPPPAPTQSPSPSPTTAAAPTPPPSASSS